MPGRILKATCFLAVSAAWAGASSGGCEGRAAGASALEYRNPGLEVPGEVRPVADLDEASAWAANEDLASLGLGGTPAFVDASTGRWATLLPSIPLFPGTGNPLTWESAGFATAAVGVEEIRTRAWSRFAEWLAANATALRIDPAELGVPRILVTDEGALVQIFVPRTVSGVEVRGSALAAVVNHGNVSLFGTEHWGDISVSTIPRLTVADARAVLDRTLGDRLRLARLADAKLFLVPFREAAIAMPPIGPALDARLVWAVPLHVADEDGEWEALVDASSAELLAITETSSHFTGPSVVGGVYPSSNNGVGTSGVLQSLPMPFLDVSTGQGTFTTDSGGNLTQCVAGPMSTSLLGTYVEIQDDCGAVDDDGTGALLDLGGLPGSTPHDCTVPAGRSAGDTAAARTAYFEVNRMNEIARSRLPTLTWLDEPVPVEVNSIPACAASASASSLSFGQGGAGCANPGEIASVLDHEWSHLLDSHGVNPSLSNPSEGIADVYAALRQNDSCVGRGLHPGVGCSGYGDACIGAPACDGLREVDFAKHQSGLPHGISWLATHCAVGGGPCGRDPYCEGLIVGEAVWDLSHRDLLAPPFTFDSGTARELGSRLTYLGSQIVTNWYQCGDGCNALGGYLNFLAVDDDNGNLGDGAPHMTAIFAAFNRHQIACASPVAVNNGCPSGPTAAPSVTIQALDRGASLSWNAIANAAKYRVYRTDGVANCALGATLVGETVATTWADDDLANGRSYGYTVLPVGSASSCFGRLSTCAPVVPVAGADTCPDIFQDGFESSDTTRWSSSVP